MTMKKTASTAKKSNSRTARRIEKHLASQNADLTAEEEQAIERAWKAYTRGINTAKKPTSAEPLSEEEMQDLQNLIHQANSVNMKLVTSACEVQRLRNQLKEAEQALTLERAAVSKVNQSIAPLLHRLPTV